MTGYAGEARTSQERQRITGVAEAEARVKEIVEVEVEIATEANLEAAPAEVTRQQKENHENSRSFISTATLRSTYNSVFVNLQSWPRTQINFVSLAPFVLHPFHLTTPGLSNRFFSECKSHCMTDLPCDPQDKLLFRPVISLPDLST